MSSLGIILMDVLRHELLFGHEGLPLGILASKQQFTEMEYLISPEFRFGLAGFARRRKRLLFGLSILTSSLISLFAGPSAALLLIPTQRSNWPAGGASFWLAGDDNSLWPSKLTTSSIGGPDCAYASMQELSTGSLNFSGCIWAGYSLLAEAFQQRHFSSGIDLIVDDGVLKRDYVIRSKGEVQRPGSLEFIWPLESFPKMSLQLGTMLYKEFLRQVGAIRSDIEITTRP